MWVHPDLVEDQQWTNVTKKKSKGMGKILSCNMITLPKEDDTHVPVLTDSDGGMNDLMTEQ